MRSICLSLGIQACRSAISGADKLVSTALAAEMEAAGKIARESKRYDVRISELQRERAAGPILAVLDAVEKRVGKARSDLRQLEKNSKKISETLEAVAGTLKPNPTGPLRTACNSRS